MHIYALYGLRIACTEPLPELEPVRMFDDAPPDVMIEVHSAPLDDATEHSELLARYSEREAELIQPKLSRMIVQDGKRITVTLNTDIPFDYVRPLLLGGALALLLSQREMFVLHGSAAEINGAGLAFVANKGVGKSTFTASVMQHGGHLIADDIAALQPVENGYTLTRGGTQIRLWMDSMYALGIEPTEHSRVHPRLEKRNWLTADLSADLSIPLKAIVELKPGDSFRVEKLLPDQAFFALLPHYYLNRWQHERIISEQSFPIVSALAARVDVLRLTLVRDLDQLDAMTRQFLDVCAGMGYFESKN